MKLDREGPIEIRVPKGSDVTMFGLAADPLREMLAELFDRGFVNGYASAMAQVEKWEGYLHNKYSYYEQLTMQPA